MHMLRTLALLVLVALTSSVLVAAPAAAAETQLTIEGAPKRGIYHDEVGPRVDDKARHTGTLTTSDGEPVPGALVTLERRSKGQDAWTDVADDETNAEGVYRFVSPIVGNADYRVSYQEGAETVLSGEAALRAMRDFNAVLVEKRRVAVLKGNINPGWDGKVVRWQRKTCRACSWKTVDQARAGDNGAWRFAGGYPPKNQTWRYRAAIDGTTDFVKSYSAQLITTRES